MNAADEKTPLQDKDIYGGPCGIGRCCCCRLVAPIKFRCLENRRHKALNFAHYISFVGVVLAILAFVGAYSSGWLLSYLSWMTIHDFGGPGGEAHAGVLNFCWNRNRELLAGEKVAYTHPSLERAKATAAQEGWADVQQSNQTSVQAVDANPRTRVLVRGQREALLQADTWKCKAWVDIECAAVIEDGKTHSYCDVCKRQSVGMTFSVLVTALTYYGFYSKTNHRFHGDDSNWTKFMACFSAFGGGVNFLGAVLSYWLLCVAIMFLQHKHVHIGAGLWCAIGAAVIKVLVGIIHLGLPVERIAPPGKQKEMA